MPMEMLNNPILADEQPERTNKMDSIFMKETQIKNIKSMNIDEKSIMESINGQSNKNENENESDELVDTLDLRPEDMDEEEQQQNENNFDLDEWATTTARLAKEMFLN